VEGVVVTDPDIQDAESVLKWVCRDHIFDGCHTLQYICRRVMRRQGSNGATEGANAVVSGIKSPQRCNLGNGSLDDAALLKMVAPLLLSNGVLDAVFHLWLQRTHYFQHKQYGTGNKKKVKRKENTNMEVEEDEGEEELDNDNLL
jgi:hypothetical protein